MPVITIREQQKNETEFEAILSFDGRGNYPIAIANPFAPQEEKQLEWYFEDWLVYPMLDTETAKKAATSITNYGEKLFEQVFQSNFDAYSDYRQLQGNLSQIQIEIESQTPEFQSLHWEAMRDRNLPRPLAVDCVMVRKLIKPISVSANVAPSSVINLLVVVARPDEEDDVGYRTISRPLIEAIDNSQLHVNVELLRPGTYKALCRHLEAKERGYYHIIHFDVHGSLMSYEEFTRGVEQDRYPHQPGYGLADIQPYQGMKAFLFLEGDSKGEAVPVEATELANLLTGRGIPVCILNACQSGKQVFVGEEDYRETSFGSCLMAAGMQVVVAMGYSVTVSAATLMMQKLYQHLFDQESLAEAIRLSRLELFNSKQRKAYFNQTIDLEDWLLPVVYSNQSVNFNLQEFTPEEEEKYYESIATQYRFPSPTYGFIGRDLEILKIEKALLKHNILLIRGMGGTGKTTLLNYLREWWQRTHYAEQSFYFGYDEKAWTLEQIVFEIGKQVYDRFEQGRFQAMSQQAQIQKLVKKLRSEPHILMLDNLESVTGQQLALQNTLSEEERNKIKDFLERLAGGETKVIFGSRSGEEWLQERTFERNIYVLQGLDKESRSDLAENILEKNIGGRRKIEKIKADEDFKQLMELLAGYPLAMEVVLVNLKNQTPQEIKKKLQTADISLDTGSEGKTKSILKCVEYSYSNLSQETQKLLLCLAPFSSFIDKTNISHYAEQLKALKPFRDYPFEKFDGAIQEAINWGLLSAIDEDNKHLLTIQPVFPYFLNTKVNRLDEATREALKEGFKNHYLWLANSYNSWMESKDAQERKKGIDFCRWQYQNLFKALQICLEQQETVAIFFCLNQYLTLTNDYQSDLKLSKFVCQKQINYPIEIQTNEIKLEIISVLTKLANGYFNIKNYQQAQEYYLIIIELIESLSEVELSDLEERQKSLQLGTIYHKLGLVADNLRKWEEAQQNYQQALDIYQQYDALYEQGITYNNLGGLAKELRKWEEAQQNYQKTLNIYQQYDDRYPQARTYNSLGNLAEKLREWESARGYYQQALEIYREYGDRYEQGTIYHNLGLVAQELREWESARRYYQQALEIKIEYGNRYSQASTYLQLGNLAQKLRQWKEAQYNYQRALDISIEYGDRYYQATTYHNLGMVAEELREWESARGYYQQALDIKDLYEQALTYLQLGNLERELRKWESARGYYQQALDICIEYGDRYSQGITYHNLGLVAQELQEWESARGYYQQALDIYIEYGDRYEQASIYNNLGNLAKDLRQWESARSYYQQALEIKIEYGDRYSQASTYNNLGTLAKDLRQWESARGYYQQALDIYREEGDLYEQASTYFNLGHLASLLQQWESARQNYQIALAIYREEGDLYNQADTYNNLGVVTKNLQEWESARQNCQIALVIYQQYDDRTSQARIYDNLGDLAKKLQQWDSARRNYRQALNIYQQCDNPYEQASIYSSLGDLAKKLQQWDSARGYYQQALDIYREEGDRLKYNDLAFQSLTYVGLGMIARELGEWKKAQQNYQQALDIYIKQGDRNLQQTMHQQLGLIARELGEWSQAQQNHQQALKIAVECGDRISQAEIYHNLEKIAEELGEWDEAKANYLQVLQIVAEFNDEDYLKNLSLPRLAHFYQTTQDESILTAAASILKTTVEELKERLS
jgi:tetratricopeptide (TPR) repeat protein